MTFVRLGELRYAKWSEFDLDKRVWEIPSGKMRMRHRVPLTVQALALLKELRPLAGQGEYLFPSDRTAARPISEKRLNTAPRRLGYSSTAPLLLNGSGLLDAIEAALAAYALKEAARA
jgi:integrase